MSERHNKRMPELDGMHNSAENVSTHALIQARDISHVTIQVPDNPPARSRYLEQVKTLVPPTLVDRVEELNDLATFCTSDHLPHPYLWVRATRWAGKSALLASFALNPPVNVRVVSFFITSRQPDQNHRKAFLDVVMEQLAALLDQPMPLTLTSARRESHFQGLLDDASRWCHDQGQRLVLVVDGLDEDRGWTANESDGPYSIAGLLPIRPPQSLRVIVSGRPNPPVPWDIPSNHPLRQPQIIYALRSSPAARVTRDDMEFEVAKLLHGTSAQRQLLGFIAVAGGLTEIDLAELTSSMPTDVRRLLRLVAGRTFDIWASQWHPGVLPHRYILGHEGLRTITFDHLGRTGTDGFRSRLHRWADDYRNHNWPQATPEYLLRGYFHLLVDAGDLARVINLVTDPVRHQRMFTASGSNYTATSEIQIAQEMLVVTAPKDYVTRVRLALHHDRLRRQSSSMPPSLPSIWAKLGQSVRAEGVAGELVRSTDRVRALAELAVTAGAADDRARAERLIKEAERLVLVADESPSQDCATATLAWAATCIGDYRLAEWALSRISDVSWHFNALAEVLKVAVASSELRWKIILLKRIRDLAEHRIGPEYRARAIGVVAEFTASVVDTENAKDLITMSLQHARTIESIEDRVESLIVIARAARRIGQPSPNEILDDAEVAAKADHTQFAASALARISTAVVDDGDSLRAGALLDEAEMRLQITTKHPSRVAAYRNIAVAAFALGQTDRSHAALAKIDNSHEEEKVLIELIRRSADMGDLTAAERYSYRIQGIATRSSALTYVAHAALEHGDSQLALKIVTVAETAARSTSTIGNEPELLNIVIGEAEAGRLERATTIARQIIDADRRIAAHTIIARRHCDRGEQAEALQLLDDARSTATGSHAPWHRALLLMTVALETNRVGDTERTRLLVEQSKDLAQHAESNELQACMFADLAQMASDGGMSDIAATWAKKAKDIAMLTDERYGFERAVAATAVALGTIGQLEQAEQLLSTIQLIDSTTPTLNLAQIAISRLGEEERVNRLLARVEDAVTRQSAPWLAPDHHLAQLTKLAATLKDHDRLFRLLRFFENLDSATSTTRSNRFVNLTLAQAAADLGDHARSLGILEQAFAFDTFTKRSLEAAALLLQLGEKDRYKHVIENMLVELGWGAATAALTPTNSDIRNVVAGDLVRIFTLTTS